MQIGEFRTFFREQSGRYDLVDSGGEDTGLDFHLMAAHRYLDGLADIKSNAAWYFSSIDIGGFITTFTQLRNIKEVWISGIDDKGKGFRKRLGKKDYSDLRGVDRYTLEANYPGLVGDLDKSIPEFYATITYRAMITEVPDPEGITNNLGFTTQDAIIVIPPTDRNITVEVLADFYTIGPALDSEISTFWSDRHPDILYNAVMRQLEIVHRNTEGVKDWEYAISQMIRSIEMDGVAQDCEEVDQMKG